MIELVKPGTNIDFIGKRRLCAALSVALIAASLIAIPIRGVRLGIDFAGGTEIQVKFAEGVEASEGVGYQRSQLLHHPLRIHSGEEA